jgi:hypothetical protein
MNNKPSLIKLTENLIIAPSQIIKAYKEGNTVYITLLDGSPTFTPILEIWDEESRVWNAIQSCSV